MDQSGSGSAQRLGLGLRASLAAGDPLVDQRLQAVGQVAGQRLEQAGELHHRGGQATGEAGEQHLARRQVGQRPGLVGGERLAAEHAALEDEVGVGAAEVAQRLGHRGGVAVDEGDRGRADEQLVEPSRPRSRTAKRTRVFL